MHSTIRAETEVLAKYQGHTGEVAHGKKWLALPWDFVGESGNALPEKATSELGIESSVVWECQIHQQGWTVCYYRKQKNW